jgi:hypothetical protein
VAARLVSNYFEESILQIKDGGAPDQAVSYPAEGGMGFMPISLRDPYFKHNADDAFSSTVVCVRGHDMLKHALRMDGWRFVIEGSAGNPKPGLRADAAGSRLDLCWRPEPRDFDRAVAFKLGYLKTYSREFGPARLSCSGICHCTSTALSGGASGKPKRVNGRDRTSLHHVENVVLHPTVALGGNGSVLRQGRGVRRRVLTGGRRAGGATRRGLSNQTMKPDDQPSSLSSNTRVFTRRVAAPASAGDTTSCCIVTVRTLSRSLTSAVENTSFKVLSFFVGKGAAGTGRLHQQSIVLADTM